MLVSADGLPLSASPEGYPLSIPNDAILVDQPGHPLDITSAVSAAGDAFFGSGDGLEEILGALVRRPSLEGYLRSRFFKGHLSMYSMSRRKAPIYWQLQVPSKAWGIWVYAPRLTRETLFAIVREADQRRELGLREIQHLQKELEVGGGARSAREIAVLLDAEQTLTVELATFKSEAERIASLGWNPDLNDGLLLNAAPLASLFPAWRETITARDEIRAGKHRWATVSRYAERI
jgi:hypothetical protein